MTHAYEPYDLDSHCLIDWNLGSNAAPEHNANIYPEDYWERVRKRIRELSLKGSARRGFTKAIGVLQDDMPEFVGEDPLFVAAKGAAEFAKRAPYTHESWETRSFEWISD
ncbi:hypothetical protein MMC08_005002 [Hypocenomyce scalaris]|nr:hypothetical protein [Hypocenomyce scalaris]